MLLFPTTQSESRSPTRKNADTESLRNQIQNLESQVSQQGQTMDQRHDLMKKQEATIRGLQDEKEDYQEELEKKSERIVELQGKIPRLDSKRWIVRECYGSGALIKGIIKQNAHWLFLLPQ